MGHSLTKTKSQTEYWNLKILWSKLRCDCNVDYLETNADCLDIRQTFKLSYFTFVMKVHIACYHSFTDVKLFLNNPCPIPKDSLQMKESCLKEKKANPQKNPSILKTRQSWDKRKSPHLYREPVRQGNKQYKVGLPRRRTLSLQPHGHLH